jgi:hypothetical protein
VDDGSDWETLLRLYQTAVRSFEGVSAALNDALAGHPSGAHFLEFVTAEEAARERVLLARMRLLKHWRDSLDDTTPLRILKPHVCDARGLPAKVVAESDGAAITRIYPTCSTCGKPQVFDSRPRA